MTGPHLVQLVAVRPTHCTTLRSHTQPNSNLFSAQYGARAKGGRKGWGEEGEGSLIVAKSSLAVARAHNPCGPKFAGFKVRQRQSEADLAATRLLRNERKSGSSFALHTSRAVRAVAHATIRQPRLQEKDPASSGLADPPLESALAMYDLQHTQGRCSQSHSIRTTLARDRVREGRGCPTALL